MWIPPSLFLFSALTSAATTSNTRSPATSATTSSHPYITAEAPACPSGWLNGHIYGCFVFLEETNISAGDAMLACEKVGGYLAEPKTLDQMAFLASLAGLEANFLGISNWWIGLSDSGHEGLWTWIHSVLEVSDTFWSQGSPSEKPGNDLDCGYMQFNNSQLVWRDLACGESVVYGGSIAPLCQTGEVTTNALHCNDPTTTLTSSTTTLTTSTTSTTTTTTVITHCPNGWSQFNQSCFWVYEEAMNWLAAEKACQDLNPVAHLASVNSGADGDYIYSLYKFVNQHQYFWLGGSDSYSEGEWTWNDGSSVEYDNWHRGSGTNEDTSKNCLSVDMRYKTK